MDVKYNFFGGASVESKLKDIRIAIDAIDNDLLELLNKRMELAREVGRIKASNGLTLFDPSREELIFRRLTDANRGPISDESLRSIYREIFAASRLLQYVLRVAYLGPEWTYSHLAARSLFGHSALYYPSPTLEDVFDAISKDKVNVAVVPIENSLQGGVGRSMDLLYERPVHVIGECFLEVAHYLCGSTGSTESVKHLYAHPQAIEQCRLWVLENLPLVEIYDCSSTAQAAQLAKKDSSGAAICNLFASHHYGLPVLAERIEDHAGNTTRFLALGRQLNSPTGNDKTSILFAVSDQPGALHATLGAFARAEVNMTRIESRPNRLLSWQYMFYADIEGHVEEPNVTKALEDVKGRVTFLKVLGSYPKGDPGHPIRPEKETLRSAGKEC
jgi:chorismate mutase/prephenate dehydratase